MFISLLGLLILVTFLEFFQDIKTGASLDIFDIYLAEKLLEDNKLKYQNHYFIEEKNEIIDPDSHMMKYYIYKLFSIMQTSDDDMFTSFLGYKMPYIKKLIEESTIVNIALDSFRSNYVLSLSKGRRYMANLSEFLLWVDILNCSSAAV